MVISAYCFMPDHMHLLVAGDSPTANFRRFVSRAKQLSGHWWSRAFGGRLWQRYGWDRVLRSEEDTCEVIRYILANPVRAGLVPRPLAYPFSGSLLYERDALIDAFGDDHLP